MAGQFQSVFGSRKREKMLEGSGGLQEASVFSDLLVRLESQRRRKRRGRVDHQDSQQAARARLGFQAVTEDPESQCLSSLTATGFNQAIGNSANCHCGH